MIHSTHTSLVLAVGTSLVLAVGTSLVLAVGTRLVLAVGTSLVLAVGTRLHTPLLALTRLIPWCLYYLLAGLKVSSSNYCPVNYWQFFVIIYYWYLPLDTHGSVVV